MKKILFVCLGNICRSPLAEAIFKHRVAQIGKSDLFEADSCGTSNYHIGARPDSRTIANALKNGITIHHKARQFSIKDFHSFDLIAVMDDNNLRNVQRISSKSEHLRKVVLLRSYDETKNVLEVPDPYYGNESDFQEVFEILDFSIKNLMRKEFRLSPTAEA
jgi:protein-tyrosine phosphatase